MTLTNYPIGGASANAGGTWSIQSTNSAKVGRFHDLMFLQEGATGNSQMVQARPGVLPGGGFQSDTAPVAATAMKVISANSGLGLLIYQGAAVVERTVLAGPYLVESTSTGAPALGTADAVNPRIDRIDLQVFDGVLGDNGGVSLTQYVVTQGTASGTPVAAAAPSNSVPLAIVTLPANTTLINQSMITDKRKSAGMRGGIRPLLPGDALADVGFVFGEMRDTSAIQTPGWIDRWDIKAAAWFHIELANGVNEQMLSAQMRTTSTTTSGATELQVLTTGAVALEASTTYLVSLSLNFNTTVNNDLFGGKIRDNNTSGTTRATAAASFAFNATPIQINCTSLYTTTTAETHTFVGTLVRAAGTGTATLNVSSMCNFLTIQRLSPSGFFATA